MSVQLNPAVVNMQVMQATQKSESADIETNKNKLGNVQKGRKEATKRMNELMDEAKKSQREAKAQQRKAKNTCFLGKLFGVAASRMRGAAKTAHKAEMLQVEAQKLQLAAQQGSKQQSDLMDKMKEALQNMETSNSDAKQFMQQDDANKALVG